MAEFYVSLTPVDATAGHQIHKSNCAELPELSTLKYLGSYASGDAAFNKSRGYFDAVTYCPKCFDKH